MLIKTNKKKAIFSKRKDVEKFSLDLQAEYIEKIATTDEELDVAQIYEKHVILVKIPIDKASAIKNKSMFIEGFVCKDISHLRSRSKLLTGFDKKSTKSTNFAIVNSEILARDAYQRKLQNTNLIKIFGVDISSTMLASIKYADVVEKKKSNIDIFGYKEHIELSNLSKSFPTILKNSERSDLSYLTTRSMNKNSGVIRSSGVFENIRLKKLSKSAITRLNFKKEFNGYLRSGIDPAVLISKSFYSSQTLDQLAKGRLQRDFKSKEDLRNFANKFHKLVEVSVSSKPKAFSIKKTKIEKVHETLEIKVEIGAKTLESLGSEIFDIIVYAKDKNKRILDYYTFKIDLKKLINKKRLIQQSLSLKKHGLMSRRSGVNTATLKISNDTIFDAEYNVLQASFSKKGLKNKYFFEKIAKSTVTSKDASYTFPASKGPRLSREKSYFYRMKVSFPEISFDNTFFDNIPAMPGSTNRTGSYVDITCINDSGGQDLETQQSINITIKNFPFDCIALNVVKRNITKKEKEFKIIKNLSQVKTNLQKESNTSLLELKSQKTSFLKKQNMKNKLSFTDNDIEEGDVYEYKALLYKDNCETELSINSYEIKYEKRKNIVSVKMSSKNNKILSKKAYVATANFSVVVQENIMEDLFNALDRNSYDLFSEEFNSIKESLSNNVSCNVSLINTSTGDRTHIGSYPVRKNKKSITVKVPIDDVFSDYKLLVTPRIASTSYVIENIRNKMENLPMLQRSLPVSSFLRTLAAQKNKARKGMNRKIVSTVPIDKYTGKSVRFFGLILDPVTKFNKEKDDFYFEGTTGDEIMFNIHSADFLNRTSALKFSSLVDLTYSQKAHGNKMSYKKLAILKMQSSNIMTPLVNFYAIYAKSNGALTFLGLISPEKYDKQYFTFCADLDETVGVTEIICVTILKDGTFQDPVNVVNLICSAQSIEVV